MGFRNSKRGSASEYSALNVAGFPNTTERISSGTWTEVVYPGLKWISVTAPASTVNLMTLGVIFRELAWRVHDSTANPSIHMPYNFITFFPGRLGPTAVVFQLSCERWPRT